MEFWSKCIHLLLPTFDLMSKQYTDIFKPTFAYLDFGVYKWLLKGEYNKKCRSLWGIKMCQMNTSKKSTNLQPKMSETGKCFGRSVKTPVWAEDTGWQCLRQKPERETQCKQTLQSFVTSKAGNALVELFSHIFCVSSLFSEANSSENFFHLLPVSPKHDLVSNIIKTASRCGLFT